MSVCECLLQEVHDVKAVIKLTKSPADVLRVDMKEGLRWKTRAEFLMLTQADMSLTVSVCEGRARTRRAEIIGLNLPLWFVRCCREILLPFQWKSALFVCLSIRAKFEFFASQTHINYIKIT